MIAIKGKVSGCVQGVGFRYFTYGQAVMLNAEGYVENLADGSVEFLIQGSPKVIERLIEKIKVGPKLARVEECRFSQIDIDESLNEFLIRY